MNDAIYNIYLSYKIVQLQSTITATGLTLNHHNGNY